MFDTYTDDSSYASLALLLENVWIQLHIILLFQIFEVFSIGCLDKWKHKYRADNGDFDENNSFPNTSSLKLSFFLNYLYMFVFNLRITLLGWNCIGVLGYNQYGSMLIQLSKRVVVFCRKIKTLNLSTNGMTVV